MMIRMTTFPPTGGEAIQVLHEHLRVVSLADAAHLLGTLWPFENPTLLEDANTHATFFILPIPTPSTNVLLSGGAALSTGKTTGNSTGKKDRKPYTRRHSSRPLSRTLSHQGTRS